MNRRRLLIVILAILLCFPATRGRASSEQPAWTVAVGVEVTTGYTYYFNRYGYGRVQDLVTGSGWAVTFSATRTLTDRLSLRGDLGCLRYDDSYPFAVPAVYRPFPQTGHRVATIPSVGLGLRLEPLSRSGNRQRGPFIDLVPTLFLARWTEELDYTDGTTFRGEKTRIAPGVALGIGMKPSLGGRYSLEVAPRFLWSKGLGWDLDIHRDGQPQGLSELTLGARVVRSL